MPKENDSKTPTPEELQQQVEMLQKKLEEEAQIRTSVTSDPDFQKLLNAKQNGKPFKVSLETDEPEKKSVKETFGIKPDENATDVNELDNKGMLSLLADAMEDFVGGAIEDAVVRSGSIMDERLAGVVDTQTKIKSAMVEQAKNTGAVQMLGQYPDFGKYQAEAWKLVQTNGLQLEDAYLLAKSKAGDANTQTEQPNQPPTRGIDLSPRKRAGAEGSEEQGTNRRSRATTRHFKNSVGDAFDRMNKRAKTAL